MDEADKTPEQRAVDAKVREIMAKADKMCGCVCHTPGLSVRHVMPCCPFTYQKRAQ